MILTGKAKEDFKYSHNMSSFNDYSEILQYALIIEWLDGLRTLNKKRGVYKFKQLYSSLFKEMENHHSISEIQKKAIIKANEIYNDRTK